jgi:hypothetical protein
VSFLFRITLSLFSIAFVLSAIGVAQPKEADEKKALPTNDKPQLRFVYDLNGFPGNVFWGAAKSGPMVFIEESQYSSQSPGFSPAQFERGNRPSPAEMRFLLNARESSVAQTSIAVFRTSTESVVSRFSLPFGHRMIGVHPENDFIYTLRQDRRGINSFIELTIWAPDRKLADTNNGSAIDEVKGPIDNKLKRVAKLLLPENTGTVYAVTPDMSAIWTTYHERNESEQVVRSGFRKLKLRIPASKDPIEIDAEVLKETKSLEGNFAKVTIDAKQNIAVVQAAAGKPVQTIDLSNGKILWQTPVDGERIMVGSTMTPDGKSFSLATSVDMANASAIYKQRLLKGQMVQGRDPEAIKDYLESAKNGSTIRFFNALDGKPGYTLTMKNYELVDQIATNGKLAATSGNTISETNEPLSGFAGGDFPQAVQLGGFGGQPGLNPGNMATVKNLPFLQIFDVESGRSIHRWKGNGTISFSPKAGDPTFIIVDNGVSAGSPSNRVGIWRMNSK